MSALATPDAPDTLVELRHLAARASPELPYVRVTGELLRRAADEIETLRKKDEVKS
jgi:hypothetical protein